MSPFSRSSIKNASFAVDHAPPLTKSLGSYMEATASPGKMPTTLEGLNADTEEARSRALIVFIMLACERGDQATALSGRAAALAAALGGA